MLGNSISLISCFPSLKTLYLNPSTVGVTISLAKFKKMLRDDVSMHDNEMMINFALDRAKKPADIDVYYCASPRQQYSLDLLGEMPPSLTLECDQFPLPQSLAGFHAVNLGQCHTLEGNNAKVIKASNIKTGEREDDILISVDDLLASDPPFLALAGKMVFLTETVQFGEFILVCGQALSFYKVSAKDINCLRMKDANDRKFLIPVDYVTIK